jgi:hypothetical protein
MKKKVLSAEALKALFVEEGSNAGASDGTNAEDNENLTEEEIAAAAALKIEEDAVAAAALAAAAEENENSEEGEETNELATMLQAELDETKALHAQAITDLEAVAVELAEATKVTVDSLKEIVVGQIAQMRLALNFATVDMSALKVSDVLTEYESTKESFMKSLPVGSITENKENKTPETPAVSSLDASNLKALGIK